MRYRATRTTRTVRKGQFVSEAYYKRYGLRYGTARPVGGLTRKEARNMLRAFLKRLKAQSDDFHDWERFRHYFKISRVRRQVSTGLWHIAIVPSAAADATGSFENVRTRQYVYNEKTGEISRD